MSRNATILYSNEDQAKFSESAESIIFLKAPTKLSPQRCFDRIEILKLDCFSLLIRETPKGFTRPIENSLARPKWSVLGRRGIGGGLRIEIRRCGRDDQASRASRRGAKWSDAARRRANWNAESYRKCRVMHQSESRNS